MSNRKYAIIGTGAIGGFYGAKLQQAGREVHFLLRSDYEYVKQNGLIIESKDGNFTLPQVNAYQDVTKMPYCDVVIIALKSTQNHLLSQLLPPLIKENTIFLVLQNGLGTEADVAQIVGNNPVIGGLCFICSNKGNNGLIRHLDYGYIALGEYSDEYQKMGITERMGDIASDFEKAGVPIEFSDDLLLAKWEKLVWNIPYNGLSVILDARTDEIMGNPDTRFLVEELMAEVVAAAKSYGRIISDEFVNKMLYYTEKMTPYRTSMKIDYDEKRPLEVEAIFGTPIRYAAQKGVKLSKIEVLYRQLKFLDKLRCRSYNHPNK
jgi:2-dehydropantoate 2-reductase